MSPRPKLPLALCLVGLAGTLLYFAYGAREALLTLLVGLPSLLLGVLVRHGNGVVGGGDALPAGMQQPARERLGPANGSAPAGALPEATMNGMREGMLVVNDSLRVVSANNAAMTVFGRGVELPREQPPEACDA